MDLSRRGFIAAVTSTLATAVPVATAVVVLPRPKVEPKSVDFEYIPPVVPVEERFGLCADCADWTTEHFGKRNRMNKKQRNGRKEGYCKTGSEEIGITKSDFGCVEFRQRRPPKPRGLHELESDYFTRRYLEVLGPNE